MMRFPPTLLTLLAALGFIPTTASAEIDWMTTQEFRFSSGPENPLILFGFNPQPEPPPSMTSTRTFDPTTATNELSGIEPTPFQIYIGVEDGSITVPPEPVVDFDKLTISFVTQGGQDLSFVISFTPDYDGDASTGISDPLFFNPQPEPPPGFDSFGFDFAFDAVASGGTAIVSVQVIDDMGTPLPLTPVAAAAVPSMSPHSAMVLTTCLLLLGCLLAVAKTFTTKEPTGTFQ